MQWQVSQICTGFTSHHSCSKLVVTLGAECHAGVPCGLMDRWDQSLVVLAARVSVSKAGSLISTHEGKAGMPPVGCAFRLALLPGTVQRSKSEQTLFPGILKDTHYKGPVGSAWQISRIYLSFWLVAGSFPPLIFLMLEIFSLLWIPSTLYWYCLLRYVLYFCMSYFIHT